MTRSKVVVIAWFLFAAAGIYYSSPLKGAEVFLSVTRTEGVRIPLTLLRVVAPSSLEARSSKIRAILEGDLRRSQVFRVIPPLPYPSLVRGEPPSTQLVRKVGSQDIEVAVWISITRKKGGDLVVEGRVYDGMTGEMILGKRYSGSVKRLRSMIHRLSDDIVLQYTGERGIADTRVIYSSTLTGHKELYLMDYDGYNGQRITNDRSINLSPSWSPDGRWVTYTSYRAGEPSIYTLELSTGRLWKMIGFKGINISPAWSPDGNNLAFASSMRGPSQIYEVTRKGKGLTRLTVDRSDSLSPAWSPTGEEIAFVSNRGGGPQIYLMKSDGTSVRRLTFNGSYNTSPDWSPKGTAIAYTCRVEGRQKICVISPDGKNQAQLSEGAWDDEAPSWSPDSRHIVFSSNRMSRGDLFMMNADGKEIERLTFNGAKNNEPAWAPY